jgi:hypothetical protein
MTEFGTLFGGMCGGRADFAANHEDAYMTDTLRTGQLRLAVLIWVMFILVCLSIFIELVAGYCVGGGSAGVTWSALPHGVWQIPNLITLFFAGMSIYLGFDTDIGSAVTNMSVCTWFILIAGILNLVQLVAVCFEINNVNSTFWLQNGGAWVWVLLFGLIVFFLWDMLIAWHLFVFRSNLSVAHYEYGWMPSGIRASASSSSDDSSTASTLSRIAGKFTPAGGILGASSSSKTKGQ